MQNRIHPAAVKFGFFVYGALTHLFTFRLYVARTYSSPTSRTFTDHPLTNLAVTLLGGAFVFLFMSGPLVREGARIPLRIPSLFLKAAGLATIATVVALQVFFALLALFGALTFFEPSVPPGPSHMGLRDAFFLMLIEIETYGAEMFFLGLPAAVCYGLICGGMLIGLRTHLPDGSEGTPQA